MYKITYSSHGALNIAFAKTKKKAVVMAEGLEQLKHVKEVSVMGKSTQEKMVCDYCGAVQEKVQFFIGASNVPAWVMNEGTGKVSCPNCFEKGKAEGRLRVQAHVKTINEGVKSE